MKEIHYFLFFYEKQDKKRTYRINNRDLPDKKGMV